MRITTWDLTVVMCGIVLGLVVSYAFMQSFGV